MTPDLLIVNVPRTEWDTGELGSAADAVDDAWKGAEVRIAFDGIDSDPREIWEFEGIRKWCRAFTQRPAILRIPISYEGEMMSRLTVVAIGRTPFCVLGDIAPEMVSARMPADLRVVVSMTRTARGWSVCMDRYSGHPAS